MPLYVNSGGWKTVKNIFVRDISGWRDIQNGWINQSGVWRQFYQKVVIQTTININGGADINLRSEYNRVNGSSTPAGANITFNLLGNATSSSTGNFALQTGVWTEPGVGLVLNINSGVVVAGKGGRGGTCSGCGGSNGGPAIGLSYPLTINNSGTVGGGGGGGGGSYYSNFYSGGGGGGGFGEGGGGSCFQGNGGGLVNGGAGGYCCLSANCARTRIDAGAGGSLGASGGQGIRNASARNPGGSPGAAIVSNGNAYTLGGDVRGARL